MTLAFTQRLVGTTPGTDDYLTAALEIAAYLRHNEVVTPEGKYWKVSPEPGNDYTDDLLLTRKGLYAGSAGIGQFFIQLYETTGDEQWLDEARQAAAYILATYEGSAFFSNVLTGNLDGIWPVAGWGTSVYVGPAGQGIFMEQLYEKTGDTRYHDFLLTTADDAIAAAIRDEHGLHWSDATDLMADGSYGFFFLYVYRKTGQARYLQAAEDVIAYTRTRRVAAAVGGAYYKTVDLRLVGWESEETVFPNYSHGAAGIAYLNALAYEATGKQHYLDAAREVVDFLAAIAEGDDSGALIPYLYNPQRGNFKEFYYLSTCHGPVGTTILFRKLYDITADQQYLEWIDVLTKGVLQLGAPLVHSKGYWNSYCLCCGAPGLLIHFVKTGEKLGRPEYLEQARHTAHKLLGDSWNDADGRRWYAAWTRKLPSLVETYTGLYAGAAGAGTALLYLYAHEKGITLSETVDYLFLR
ncbi:MAG: lanthionine synthetase [Actinomycetaceae bacterium]|nr:lanthionine synthetase [Actinomycetaceae bacterium]